MQPELEVCAGGVVSKDGKIVILKRKNGVWLMPKGHVDPGETLEEAATREVKEETGLVAEVGVKLGETEYTHHEDGRPHRKKVHWFFMEVSAGTMMPEDGMFTDIALIEEDGTDILSFEHDRELARKAFALMKKDRRK